MESYFRGFLEQKIEEWLETDQIKEVYNILSYLQTIKVGLEDVVFGFIVASLYDALINLCFVHYYRVPNDNEIDELMDIIKRRTGEIKQLINHTVSK
jgi:hypothetical protein